MLANQRFCVFITEEERGRMVITVMPKTRGLGVLLGDIREMSFVLMDVVVGGAGSVSFEVRERYIDAVGVLNARSVVSTPESVQVPAPIPTPTPTPAPAA